MGRVEPRDLRTPSLICLQIREHAWSAAKVPHFFMASDIVSLIQAGSVSSPEIADPYLINIDRNIEYVHNPSAPIAIAGYGNLESCPLFIGRQCRGSIGGNVRVISSQELRLELKDDLGHFEIPLTLEPDGPRFMNDTAAFKIYRNTGTSIVSYWVPGGTASVDYASIRNSSGSIIEIIVERNSQTNRIRIRYREGGKLKELFAAFHFV